MLSMPAPGWNSASLVTQVHSLHWLCCLRMWSFACAHVCVSVCKRAWRKAHSDDGAVRLCVWTRGGVCFVCVCMYAGGLAGECTILLMLHAFSQQLQRRLFPKEKPFIQALNVAPLRPMASSSVRRAGNGYRASIMIGWLWYFIFFSFKLGKESFPSHC